MLLWADFPSGQEGLYGNSESAMLDGIWADLDKVSLVDDPDPGVTGKVLLIDGSTAASGFPAFARFVLPTAGDVVGIASRVWLPGLPSNTNRRPIIHSFRDSSNNAEIDILVDPSGYIQAYRGGWTGSGVLLGTSASPALTAQAWHHVETKVLKSATVGTVEVRVNGITVLELTEQNTGADDVAQVGLWQLANGNGGTDWYTKDFIVWDDSGSEVNDFQGAVIVRDLVPDTDVSLGGWTTSAGATGFDLINQDGPPTDSDYVAANDTPPAAAEFTLDDLPADTTTVRGLISIVRALKTDGGDATLQVSLSPNGTDYDDGTDRPITSAATYWSDVSTLSPDTSVAWTVSEVNALRIKLNRTL